MVHWSVLCTDRMITLFIGISNASRTPSKPRIWFSETAASATVAAISEGLNDKNAGPVNPLHTDVLISTNTFRSSSNKVSVNRTFLSGNYDLGAPWCHCKTRWLPFIELVQEVADERKWGHSLHSPFQGSQHKDLHPPNIPCTEEILAVAVLLPYIDYISETPLINHWKLSRVLRRRTISFNWRSSRRGTTVSSILAARDRQATDNNCCIQGLSCYNNKNKQSRKMHPSVILR
jgi:hypothetical protein